ncbi:hypothetical protein [uncultured Jatrophihabitans sp.]|uniref:hypothetical protein n=1 Tax=uncultured Jatrophihabitans sp. TaxID=1610747 RepID=UPI0035C9F367
MAMHGDTSPEARSRAGRTVDAAAVFAEHAEHIVQALPDLPDGHVLVAVVDDGHAFSGTHHVEQERLVERIPELEGDGGWAMVFTGSADADDVRRRTDEMATLARRRGEMIDRILAKRAK